MANESFRVDGAEALRTVAKLLREQGDGKELKKQLAKELRQIAVPLSDLMREALANKLPQRGGAARSFRNARWSVRNRFSGENAGVRITSNKKHDYASLERRGRLRHPVWADPGRTRRNWRWVDQKVPTQGLYAQLVEEQEPEMVAAFLAAIDTVLDKIEGS